MVSLGNRINRNVALTEGETLCDLFQLFLGFSSEILSVFVAKLLLHRKLVLHPCHRLSGDLPIARCFERLGQRACRFPMSWGTSA